MGSPSVEGSPISKIRGGGYGSVLNTSRLGISNRKTSLGLNSSVFSTPVKHTRSDTQDIRPTVSTPLSRIGRKPVGQSPQSSIGRVLLDDIQPHQTSGSVLSNASIHKKKLDDEMERSRYLAAELVIEKDRRRDIELRTRTSELLSSKGSTLESRISELEKQLEDRNQELVRVNEQRSGLENTVLALQTNGEQKVLEGRLAGAKTLLADKTAALENERRGMQILQSKSEQLTEELVAKGFELDRAEREIGEKEALLVAARNKTNQLEKLVGNADIIVASQREKVSLMENGQILDEANSLKVQTDLQEQLREKDKIISSLESDLNMKSVQRSETEASSDQMRKDVQRLQAELQQYEQKIVTIANDKEQLQSHTSQTEVLIDGVRMELSREVEKVESLTLELKSCEQSKDDIEMRLRESQSQVSRNVALQSKLDVLESALARNDEDLAGETTRHRATKQRIHELELKLSHQSHLQQGLLEMELELNNKMELISHMQDREDKQLLTIEEMKHSIAESNNKTSDTQNELHQVMTSRDELQNRISDLEIDAVRKSGFEGKAKGLEDVLRQRCDEVKESNQRNNQLVERLRDFESELETYTRTKGDLLHCENERRQLILDVERLQGTISDLELTLNRERSTLKESDTSLAQQKSHISNQEQIISDLQQELAIKSLVTSQLQEVRDELSRSVEEKTASSQKLELLEAKNLINKQDNLKLENRNTDLEGKINRQVSEIQSLQVKLGEQTVTMESKSDEMTRIHKEADWKTHQYEVSTEQNRRLMEELATKKESVDRLEDREKRRADLVEELRSEIENLTSVGNAKEQQLITVSDQIEVLEKKNAELSEHQTRATVLEGKVKGLQEIDAERSLEFENLKMQADDLKSRLTAAAVEAATTRQLQDIISSMKEKTAEQSSVIQHLEAEDTRKDNLLTDYQHKLEEANNSKLTTLSEFQQESSRCDQLISENEFLKTENSKRSELEGKIAGLEALVESKERDLSNAVDHSRALSYKIKQYELEMTDRSIEGDRVTLLEHEISTKVDLINRLESQEIRRREVEQSLRNELEGETDRVATLKQELQHQTHGRMELEQRLRSVEEEAESVLREATTEKNELKQSVIHLQSSIRDLENNTNSTTSAAKRSAGRIQSLQDENKSLIDTLMTIEEHKGRLEVENSEFKRLIQSEHSNSSAYTKTLNEQKAKVLDLERELKKRESSQIASENKLTTDFRLKLQQLENAEMLNKEIKRDLEDKSVKLHERSESLSKVQDKLLDTERRYRESQEHSVMLQRYVSDSEKKLQDSQVKQSSVLSLKDEVQDLLHKRESELSQIISQHSTCDRRLKEQEAKSKNFEKHLSEKDRSIHELKNELNSTHAKGNQRQKEAESRIIMLENERFV